MSENISELGQALLDRVREAINEEWGRYTDQAPEGWETEPFVVTFLRSRDGCVPDEYLNEDDARDSIVLMFGFVFWSIAEAIEDTAGVRVSVAIEPDLMNETRVVMYSMELRTLLLVVRKKAWRLHWESEAAMAKDLENWYTHALIALKQAQRGGVMSLERYFDAFPDQQLARYTPPGSLVRLPDGRVGVMGYGNRRKAIVLLSKDVGVEVSLNTRLTVLVYPVTLAIRVLAAGREEKASEALLDDDLLAEQDDDPGEHFMDSDGRPSERGIYDDF